MKMRTSLSAPRLLLLTTAACMALACGSAHEPADGSEPVAVSADPLTSAQAALATWSGVITLPIIPVAGANMPDGKLLFWAAEDRFGFGPDLQRTYTAMFNPATNTATERLVNETGHDMFCPGTANLPDGRILVNGGLSSGATSIYDPPPRAGGTAAPHAH